MILIRISDVRDAARYVRRGTVCGTESPRSRAGLQDQASSAGVLTVGAGLPRDKIAPLNHCGLNPLLQCKPRHYTASERTFRSTFHSLALAATIQYPL